MPNLIPEVRVNKNGVPVVKHVRPDSGAKKSSIPLPSIQSAPEKKKVKLLARQKEAQLVVFNRSNVSPSKALLNALPLDRHDTAYHFNISDVNAYEMFSSIPVNDAVHLIHFGYATKASAIEFLKGRGLNKLAREDNSAMMREALERRLPASKLVAMHSTINMQGHPSGVFLDTVEAYSSGTLTQLNRPQDAPIHMRVAAGDIAMGDIKTIGISRLQKSNAAPYVLHALQEMRAGKLDCTAEDIRELIIKNDSERNTGDTLIWALESINNYGVELLKSTRLSIAQGINDYHRSLPFADKRELVKYYNTTRDAGTPLSPMMVGKLKKAGVDPESAVRLYKGGLTVEQIIGAHEDDIASAVSTGWL